MIKVGPDIPGIAMSRSRQLVSPATSEAKNWHPGEEIVYVLEGSLRYQVEGKPAVTLEPGQVLFIPAKTTHAAKNVGTSSGAELEAVVHRAVGPSQLMEFVRFDAGGVLREERGRHGPQLLRLVIGNSLIMMEMARIVPDAASYAPVTILVDERADGVHLSYDTMASLLAPYGSEPALAAARDLDIKVESPLETAAR